MAVTHVEARDIAARYVSEIEQSMDIPLKLLDETVSRMSSWTFFYGVDLSRGFDVIAGNGPLIVCRNTGELHLGGSANPAEWYINRFEETGSVD